MLVLYPFVYCVFSRAPPIFLPVLKSHKHKNTGSGILLWRQRPTNSIYAPWSLHCAPPSIGVGDFRVPCTVKAPFEESMLQLQLYINHRAPPSIGGGWDDGNLNLAILHCKLDSNSETLPVFGGFRGDIFSDLLWRETEWSDLGRE